MRRYLAVLLIAGLRATGAPGAVIRGVVVENQSGKALARTTIVLEAIEGTPGGTRTLRTSLTGGFEFDGLAAGTYVVRASRMGFMPMEYGQKRWNSAGTPVVLEESAGVFLNIRLLRYSAIRGTVADENDVGLPEHEVVAYRYGTPPVLVANAITDDRGIYRLHGLEPGTYLVRTAGKRYEDEAYVPTFSTETERVEQARTVDVAVEQEADSTDVRPLAGNRFFALQAAVGQQMPGTEVTLTLASELGRKIVKGGAFRFTDLPAGDYEVYAESRLGEGAGEPLQAAYQRISLGRDEGANLLLQPPPQPPGMRGGSDIAITGVSENNPGRLWIRRKDLAGVGAPYQARIVRGRANLPVGRWEVLLQPPSGFYVAGFSGTGAPPVAGARPDGWNEVLCRGYGVLQFAVSSGPSAIHGTVKRSGDGVPGAPVYLEGYDTETHARVIDLRATRTDAHGQYSFADLAPGTYRILGTFEYLAPDVAAMDLAGAQMVTVNAHGDVAQDVDLYVIQ